LASDVSALGILVNGSGVYDGADAMAGRNVQGPAESAESTGTTTHNRLAGPKGKMVHKFQFHASTEYS
jgi:glycine/serine hydroxymethyltransferase